MSNSIGAGLAGAFVVSLVPIATFALQEMTGLLGLPPYASATDPNLARFIPHKVFLNDLISLYLFEWTQPF